MGDKGNFFAIDRRVWNLLCDFGQINPIVAYLVLARGSGRDQRTSSWSTHAIEKHTKIPRRAAKAAIDELILNGFIELHKGGTRPRYLVRPADEICVSAQPRTRRLKPAQAILLEAVLAHPAGIRLPSKEHRDPNWPEGVSWGHAEALIMDGLARRISPTGIAAIERQDSRNNPAWIWLPNTIVDGADGETPPIERLRQTHSVSTVRLYVNLYFEHYLPETGGISWRKLRQSYHRSEAGQFGAFGLYGFMPNRIEAFPGNDFYEQYFRRRFKNGDIDDLSADKTKLRDEGMKAFFADLKVLTDTGLVQVVPHLVTADTGDGTVIHPLARDGEGEAAEREIGAAAEAACLEMLAALGNRGPFYPEARFVPMEPHIQHLALVGVFRMRHRPHTAATAAWLKGGGGWSEGLKHYRRLQTATSGNGLAVSGFVQHQGEVKEGSKRDQR